MSSTKEYRDKIYIRKDILLKLSQYGSLNQTSLLSFCGLNLQKHKKILDEMESKGLIERNEEFWGTKRIIQFKPTELGKRFCKMILEPYESMFPRKKKQRRREW